MSVSPRRREHLLDIAVVGGGMVGAAAALALARVGLTVVLLEARQPPVWSPGDPMDLRVVSLAPSAMALLDELNVWSVICRSRISPYAYMHVWDSHSGAAIDFDAMAQGRDVLGVIVENRLVQWALWQALETAAVRCLYPARVDAIKVRENDVLLTLTDGQMLTAQLLVAADGAASPLRALAGITTRGRDYAQCAVVAHVTTERTHQHTAWQCFLSGGALALLPLPDGRSSLVWSLPKNEAQRVLAMEDTVFCDALGPASDFCLGRVTATTRRTAFPLQLQLATRYQAQRLVLLGDAAHVVHPLAGQGVNLGLRDVVELREVLVAARHARCDLGAAHVLRRYARRQRSSDTIDACIFDALARIYAWRSPWLVGSRGLGVHLLNRFKPLKRRIITHAAGV